MSDIEISDTWVNRYIPTIKINCCGNCPFFIVGHGSEEDWMTCTHPSNSKKDIVFIDSWLHPNKCDIELHEELMNKDDETFIEEFNTKTEKQADIHLKERHPNCPLEPAGFLVLPV